MNASRYFHTLRYLRPVQIYGRLWQKLYHPKPDLSPPSAIRPLSGIWRDPVMKSPSLIGANRFCFLNVEHDILLASDWNHPAWAKLWLYNLHYFDDLTAVNATDRIDRHHSLIMRWVAENPPGTGNGWEPYPLSRRIVNWIKWALAGHSLPRAALESLAIQTRFLAKRMEYHLLGNHLLANAKALVFAGLFFEGKEADAWVVKGLRILNRELPKQILKDGGHFERSPMYHSIILEDLLDVTNFMQCDSDSPAERGNIANPSPCRAPHRKGELSGVSPFIEAAKRMIAWLKVMCQPDGQIALFNDAAFGIAPQPAALYEYAERLGIHESDRTMTGQQPLAKSSIECLSFGHIRLTHLKTSGYIRIENGSMTAILDVAPIGPDYLPGHAHADTLTFEMAFHDQRVIVDSGTSRYDEGDERLRQRSTAAHNTVALDGKDSSEVWGSFRVARRARPYGLEIKETSRGAVVVRCAHDGYRRLSGKPNHWREWHFDQNSLAIHDVIEGRYSEAVGRFHFHPAATIENRDNGFFSIALPRGEKLSCHVQNGHGHLVSSTFHPEFGLDYQNQCLEVQLKGKASNIVFDWS